MNKQRNDPYSIVNSKNHKQKPIRYVGQYEYQRTKETKLAYSLSFTLVHTHTTYFLSLSTNPKTKRVPHATHRAHRAEVQKTEESSPPPTLRIQSSSKRSPQCVCSCSISLSAAFHLSRREKIFLVLIFIHRFLCEFIQVSPKSFSTICPQNGAELFSATAPKMPAPLRPNKRIFFRMILH